MALKRINGSGTTLADMKSHKANPTPIQWKQTMQNYDTIWHGWLASLVVSLVARMLSNVPYVCLSSASTVDNFTNNASLTTKLMSWTS